MLSVVNADGSTESGSLTDEIVREGARRMLAGALEAEVNQVHSRVGRRDVQPTTLESRVRLTRRQAAVWYVGGHRSDAARLTGVHAIDGLSLTALIRSTTDHEPWLAEHF